MKVKTLKRGSSGKRGVWVSSLNVWKEAGIVWSQREPGHDNCDRNDHDSGISHGDDRFEIFKDVINYIFNIFDFLVNVMEILWLNEVLIWI